METSPLVDCRGLQCPAPILRLSDAARKHRATASTLTVLATDADFPVDLEAWCRTTKSSVLRLDREEDGVIRAQIRLAVQPGATAAPVSVAEPQRPTVIVPRLTSTGPAGRGSAAVLDLTGLGLTAAMRRLNDVCAAAPGQRRTILADAEGFDSRFRAWATAMDATFDTLAREGARWSVTLRFASDTAATSDEPESFSPGGDEPRASSLLTTPAARAYEAPAPVAPSIAPLARVLEPDSLRSSLPLASPVAEPAALAAPRENRTTLLILHNDLEALLAALMVANASAAQGMAVDVYFSFWGIHLLRGERPRPDAPRGNPGFLQRMMLWMVPKGPSRQRLGKLHMGGLGTRILLRLMRKRNILALDQLIAAAASQGVVFRVCSMSMGLMGLSQRDIVDLPNVQFAGVTSFAEAASRSAVSLVF